MARFLTKRVTLSPIKRSFLKTNTQRMQVTNDIKGNVVISQEIKEKIEEATIQVETTVTPKEEKVDLIETIQEEEIIVTDNNIEETTLEETKENNVISKKRKRKHDYTRKDNASQPDTI